MKGQEQRQRGEPPFVHKVLLALTTGMVRAKVMRHLLTTPLVYRPLHAILKALFPVNPRKVVCATFSGACECNPKYIAQELERRGGVEVVWLLGMTDYRIRAKRARERGFRVVPLRSVRALYHLVTAGVWVDNAQTLLSAGLPSKRPNQRCLNTWHGSLGIKRLTSAERKIRDRIRKAETMTDAVLVNSTFEEEVFRESVFPRTKFLAIGHPRNDVFFLPEPEKAAIRARVRAELGLADGESFALYAPTFREVAFFTTAGGLDFGSWGKAFEARFGGKWRIVLRLHPHDARALAEGFFSLPPGVCDLSEREDIQELLIAADAGITDYSSWIFDYLLGGSPGFVFAPDKAKYDGSRGFYYPLEETPFPVAESETALCEVIRSFDTDRYALRRIEFLKARGCREDGHASERAADWIETELQTLTHLEERSE